MVADVCVPVGGVCGAWNDRFASFLLYVILGSLLSSPLGTASHHVYVYKPFCPSSVGLFPTFFGLYETYSV